MEKAPETIGADDRTMSPDLDVLYRIAAVGLPRADEDVVVNEVLRVVRDVIACEWSFVCLWRKDTDELSLRTSEGGKEVRIPLAEPTVIRRIFHSGRSEVINELVTDVDSSPALAQMLHARQLVAAPLVGEEALGVIGAVNSRKGRFTDDDLRLLTVVADRASLAVENAQLRATLKREEQELEGLHRLSRLLTSSETLDRVVAESVRIACDLLGCGKVVLSLYDDQSRSLIARPETVGVDDEATADLRIPLSEPTLTGTVFRTDTTLVSNTADSDSWVSEELRELLGIETVMVVPLNPGAGPIGVLTVINSKKGHFDDGDVRFGALLGSRIASAIESSRARERERALVQGLREADQTKSEFVSMLAHELKGPMTTITGFCEVLQKQWGLLAEEKREHIIDVLTKEMMRMSRLVSDLLDLSRMEAGTLRYEVEPVVLRDLVDSILQVHTSLRQHHAVLPRLPEDLPKVAGDPDRLRQVFINLLTNATRYSPDGTTVTIRGDVVTEDGHDYVRVSVADEGIGIAPEDRGRVFSKFVNLQKPGWVPKGTGLGLYITKGIIEALSGRLWVESQKGQGSIFFFTVPVANAN